jgi:hypothetical protein
MGKWSWHYTIEREALWRSVVETKFDSMRLVFKGSSRALRSRSVEIY